MRGTPDTRSATLNEMMRAYENNIIRQALITSQGSVTKAAILLGISHQSLIHILESRHSDLLSLRTPVKPRKRSVVKKRGAGTLRKTGFAHLPDPNNR